MSKLSILISGGGIAGPCLAWWLNKAQIGARITVVERASEPRTSGQAVDIRDAAVDVIKNMGLEAAIRGKTTTEEGIDFVYADGVTKARFPASGDSKSQSMTSEYEILRGDLAKIFYDETKHFKAVDYVFDEYIIAIEQQEDGDGKVKVKFANHLPETEYDLVVGADGMISRTRRLVFGRGPNDGDYLNRLGQHMAFFTIPRIDSDTTFSQWYFGSKGRLAVLRPSQYNDTRVLLAVTDWNFSRFEGIEKATKERDEKAQKIWLTEQFEGAGWQTARIVDGMKTTNDFYIQETAQVKMEKLVRARFALLGDAGFCPSPISGVGTTVALVGAYILAGEISQSPSDIPQALERYQSTLRPFINQCQKLAPGAPQLFNPQSEWGVKILDTLGGIASYSVTKKLFGLVSGLVPRSIAGKKWETPVYSAFED